MINKKHLNSFQPYAPVAHYGRMRVVVRHYNYAGPYEVKKPFLADSLDVNSKRFSRQGTIEHDRSFSATFPQSGQTLDAASSGELTLPTSASSYALHLVSFYLNSDRYTKGTLRINGPGDFSSLRGWTTHKTNPRRSLVDLGAATL